MSYALHCLSRGVLVILLSAALAACGGGGGGGAPGGGGGAGGPGSGGSYTVSVVTSGLKGSGLSVGLSSDAGMETMSISANGTRTFSLRLPAGSMFTVGIGSQPPGQKCSIGGQFYGTSISSNVTATVTCVDTMSVGVTVSGLSGTLGLRLSGGGWLTVDADGSYTFDKALTSGTWYAVTVSTQPVGQLCRVNNAYGQMDSTSISDVSVTCSAAPAGYRVGGNVSGFSGLVVLTLNGGEELPTTYNGSFTFSTPLPTGTSYSVGVGFVSPGYECSVVNGTGVIAESDYPFVDVDCQKSSTLISPKVDPDGAYLNDGESITVTLNGSEDLTLDDWDFSPVAFKTDLSPGDAYEVTIQTQPPGRLCALFNSVGVIEAGVIPVISMRCTSNSTLYTIGGTVSNLSGTGLVLNLDGRESLAVTAGDTSYVFPDGQLGNMFHRISVEAQPAGQICTLSNSSSYVSGNVTDVNVICSDGSHSIGGYVSGLTSPGLVLELNGAEALSVPAGAGSFVFSSRFASGMSYEVGILEQPTDQVCTLDNEAGYSISASVSNVFVDCRPRDYAVAVNVSGYSGSTPLLLQLNGGEIMEVTSSTASGWGIGAAKPFTTRLGNGEIYSVSVAAHPEGRLCSLTNPSGVVDRSDVTNIGVVCEADAATAGSYTVGVTTSGFLGYGLTLQLNGGNDLPISGNGYSSFAASLPEGAAYEVTVLTQSSDPIQLCEVVNGTGTVGTTDVTNVSIQCGNAVQSLYPNSGGNWLYYVKNDGPNVLSASDTACDPAVDTGGYDACLNGGEFVSVALPHLTSCLGVTASDNLDAFSWECDASDGVRVVSTGLKNGMGLSDLVDFYEGAFKPNFVTIHDGGAVLDTTQPAIWWNNAVQVNNFGGSLFAGEIHLVTGTVPSSYTMYGRTALLVQPGHAIAGQVSASKTDFLWFEGAIEGSNGTGLQWSETDFSVLNKVQSRNNLLHGISVRGNNLKLRNVTANGNMEQGMYLSGRYHDALNLTASDNLGTRGGIQISGRYLTLRNLVANDNVNGSGIRIETGGDITLSDATANGNGVAYTTAYDGRSGIELLGNFSSLPSSHVFTNLTANGNLRNGVFVDGIAASSLTDINVHDNGLRGFHLATADATTLSNVHATGNGEDGIWLFRWDGSKADTLIAANNGGHGVYFDQCGNDAVDAVSDVISSNNAGNGYVLGSSDNVISANVTAVNNAGTGVGFFGSSTTSYRNVLIGATSANNGVYGVAMTRSEGLQLSSILSANNGGDGFYTSTFISNLSLVNLLSSNNTGYGFHLGSEYNYFGGLLHMGNNLAGDCLIEYFEPNEPGLMQTGNGNKLTNDCQIATPSDGTVVPLVDASSSLVAKISGDDVANPDDMFGAAQFDYITDWVNFDHAYRVWGVDGALAFADSGNRGACNALGTPCRIWDWSASAADAGNSGAPAVHGVVGLPTLADKLTMDWTTSAATDQAYCDARFPGSTWDGAGTCTSTYLRAARELVGDGVGNDNHLCEAGEDCLYMPNIGSHQGQGTLVPAGSVDTITLFTYETLAR